MSQPVNLLKPTFSSGELAPSLHYRVDLQRYSAGSKTMRNFFVHSHGGASNRPGTYFTAKAKYSSKKARGWPFEYSSEEKYSIEFGDHYARFYTNGAQIGAPATVSAWASGTVYRIGDFVLVSGTVYRSKTNHTSDGSAHNTPPANTTDWEASNIYEITTPYAEVDLPNLKFSQSADVLYITDGAHWPQMISRYGHIDWRLEAYPFEEGPFRIPNTDGSHTITPSAVTGSGITLTASKSLFQSGHVGALFKLEHYIPGQAVAITFSGPATSLAIKCFNTWRIISHGTWTGSIVVEKSTDGGVTWTDVRLFSSANDYNPNTYGTEQETDPFLVRVRAASLSSGACSVDLTTDSFTQTGVVKITGFTSSTAVTCTVTKEIGAASATADWAEGAWSTVRGFPTSSCFFQDRLVFAGGQEVWTTKTTNYVNFGRSNPLVASDGISVRLPSMKMNAIESIVPLGKILAFTSSSEWSVGPGSDGVFAPTSGISQVPEGYRGANGVTPIVIGNRVIFVQPMGSVVQDMGYDYASNSFTGDPISLLSSHLFEGKKIVAMAYQQEPHGIVWCVRDDGVLLSMTYLKAQDVVAWTRHDTEDGESKFEDVWTLPGDGYNEVWFIVKRGNERFVERMAPRLVSKDPRDQFFVDCGMSYDNPITITGISTAAAAVVSAPAHGLVDGDFIELANVDGMETTNSYGKVISAVNNKQYKVASATTNSFSLVSSVDDTPIDTRSFTAYKSGGQIRALVYAISGLDHLEGKTVAILADGYVLPRQVVVSGTITLSRPAARVHIGLPYDCDLIPLNMDMSLASDSSKGVLLKVSQVTLCLLDSRGGWIGPDEDNLDEITQFNEDDLGATIDLFTGEYPQTINTGYKTGGEFMYRQRDPLPVTVLAVIPKITAGG